MKKNLVFLFCFSFFTLIAQNKKIRIISSDISTVDEKKFPDATILIGNVKIAHEGATLDCKRALLYKKKNLFEAIGEVVLEQGDSIIQYSDFAKYNGNTKMAKSWGNVEANDKTMKLSTDTLYFDRNKQVLYYPNKGTIRDKKNTLNSNRGTYFIKKKKFTAKSNVSVVNPENKLNSNHLDYYTNTNIAYLYGATTITNLKDSTKIFAKRGFYDSNTDISYFVKDAKLYLKNKTVSADSMYYDKRKGFASATNRIKVVDTINKMVTKGNYAEIFEKKDSLFMVDRAVSITVKDKDSMYVHGDTIMITGKPKKRIIRTFHNVKIFKSNLQGKCDSIFTSEETGFTKMYKKPIIWSMNSQITGDSIQILSNPKTEQLDSLFIYNNAFMIQKDSIHPENFNQIKGRNMFGKFEKNDLKTLLVKGNSQSIYYNNNEKSNKLETITKELASDIEFTLQNNEIYETKYLKKTQGKTYPPSKFPDEEKKFDGFIWLEEQQPKTKEDIFLKKKKKTTTKTKDIDEVDKAKKKLKAEQKKKKLESSIKNK